MQTLDQSLSKKNQILSWARNTKIFSSVHVRGWGITNYCLNPDRRIRELMEEGLIEHIPSSEAILLGLRKDGQARVAWYRFIGV